VKVDTQTESAELTAAEQKLEQIREDIVSGKTTFARAAAKHSDAPSRDKGGDVGFFPYRGKMPAAFCDVAFSLKPGEITKPFRSPFGVHILKVTDQRPGQLSLEDVRPQVRERLARQMREDVIRQQRSKARIKWMTDANSFQSWRRSSSRVIPARKGRSGLNHIQMRKWPNRVFVTVAFD